MKYIFLSLLLLFFAISCKQEVKHEQIEGIWMTDFGWTNYYNPDTTSKINTFLLQGKPLIIDFQKDKNLILKVLGNNETHMNWNIKEDSILTIDKYNYKIKYINKDTLELFCDDYSEKYEKKLYRIKDKKIKTDSLGTLQLLESVIWIKSETHPSEIDTLKYDDYIEYMKHNAKLTKFWIRNPENLKHERIDYQLDRWSIENYKNYFFISEFFRSAGDRIFGNINQITELNDSVLKLYSPDDSFIKYKKYNAHKPKINIHEKEKQLYGYWICKNNLNKSYGKNIPKKRIKAGIYKYYDGNLKCYIDSIYITQYWNNEDSLKIEWIINKDATVLIYVLKYQNGNLKKEQLTLNKINSLTENIFEIKSERNDFPFIPFKENKYIFNITQKFKKIIDKKKQANF